MARNKIGTSAAIAACCAAAGLGLVGCDDTDDTSTGAEPSAASSAPESDEELITGTQTITVGDYSVNVSCSGTQVGNRPVVILMHGGGDDLTTMADLQETLSENGRVCSYDRLGAGASDQPAGPQDYEEIGEILTGVIEQTAGGRSVVLAGHSMGGLLAGRYAPEHTDLVSGVVLMDATSPSAIADLEARIPESATGDAAELRAQTLAVYQGQNPEQLVFTDGEVRSAGDIPVRVIQHGQQYLAEMTEYGPGLEEDWAKGQEEWLALSENSELSTAEDSGHYIYVDQPEIAVEAIEQVTEEAAG